MEPNEQIQNPQPINPQINPSSNPLIKTPSSLNKWIKVILVIIPLIIIGVGGYYLGNKNAQVTFSGNTSRQYAQENKIITQNTVSCMKSIFTIPQPLKEILIETPLYKFYPEPSFIKLQTYDPNNFLVDFPNQKTPLYGIIIDAINNNAYNYGLKHNGSPRIDNSPMNPTFPNQFDGYYAKAAEDKGWKRVLDASGVEGSILAYQKGNYKCVIRTSGVGNTNLLSPTPLQLPPGYMATKYSLLCGNVEH